MPNVLEKLSAKLPEMSTQQKKIARYVLEHYKKAAFMTSVNLAKSSEASTATVNRLAVLLGYSGYAEFQIDLQMIIQSELTALDRIEDEQAELDSLSSVFREEARALERALQNISKTEYSKALNKMYLSRRLIVVGHQASEPVAEYAVYSLSKVRPNVQRLDIGRLDGFNIASSLCDQDVALVFGMPRYPKRTDEAVEELKKRGVPIILVAHSELSPYCADATINLIVPVQYHRFTDGLSPLISLVNSLALDIYARNEQAGRESLERFESVSKYLYIQSKS